MPSQFLVFLSSSPLSSSTFIHITSVYACRFITTISYHSVTVIFYSTHLFHRLASCEPAPYVWLCMIITLFLYPTTTRRRNTLENFSYFVRFHNFILIHWIFICTYIKLYINKYIIFLFGLALLAFTPQCFVFFLVIMFASSFFVLHARRKNFFIVWELYGLFYFVLNFHVSRGKFIGKLFFAELFRSQICLWCYHFTHQLFSL